MNNSASSTVFPVYAGVILCGMPIDKSLKRVPRVCGGDPIDVGLIRSYHGVFPVYAGVILTPSLCFCVSFCVPRVCGGDPICW